MKYHIYLIRPMVNKLYIECSKYHIKDGFVYFTDKQGEGCIPVSNVKVIMPI